MLTGEPINLPTKVIATTITPFDKFPTGERIVHGMEDDNLISTYKYLGSKNRAGHISGTGQISRVVESLFNSSKKDNRGLARLSQVFEFLGYLPRIEVDYDIRFSRKAFQAFNENEQKKTIGLEDLLHIIGRGAFVSSLERRFLKKPSLIEDVYKALEIIEAIMPSKARTITVAVDFEDGRFTSATFEVFQQILFLKKLGLIFFRDLRLFKLELEKKISVRDASSGEQAIVLTFLGIASEIEDNSLIIIDEPEISLHPEWQEKFIPLLNSTFSIYRGCHFLLATHSPLLLSKLGKEHCAIVKMDNFVITNAKEFFKKSADYQLAEAFSTPGYRNEYLAREGLAALRLASHREINTREFQEKVELLRKIRPQLQDDDPVAQIVDALVQMLGEMS